MKRILRAAAILLVVPLFAAACGDSDEDAPPAATSTPAAQAIDLSKDDLGRAVTAPANPQRVVAMSPTIVELMYAVGVTPAGRPSSANFPEAAKSVADFGTSYQWNAEAIVAMNPDLIIADAILQETTIEELARLGAPVFAIEVDSFEEVTRGLRIVGALTGKTEAAEREAKALEDKLAGIKAKIPAEKPNVLIVVGAGPTQVFAARNDSYVGSLVELLGGKNVAASEPETFRLPGFGEYSLEKIVEKDPDVIIAISPGQPNVTTTALSRSPIWSSLKAVKAEQVHEVSPVVYIEAAGPRVSLILDELPGILYPNVFAGTP